MENPTVVFEAPERVAVHDRDVPDPGPDEALIRTTRTLISTGTELTLLTESYPEGSTWDDISSFPVDPGYDNVGVVEAVGDDVERLSAGDRVASPGGHAAYVAAEADRCHRIPDGVTDDQATFCTIAQIVMNGVRRGRVDWGEAVAVYGLGLLGQLAVRICRVAGARPVVGFDLSAERLEYLPDDAVGVDPTGADAGDAVADRTDGSLADVVFEVTGNPDAITGEFDALRDQGRLVLLSSPRGETRFDFHDHCNAPSYEIIGSHSNSHPPVATPRTPWTKQRHAALFFEYLADGSIDVASLISHRRPFEEAPALYEMLLEDRTDAMGVLLDWGG